jgi:hypothetical protein
MSLTVDGSDRAAAFTVQGADDRVSTMTTGTVEIAKPASATEGHLQFFVAGHRLFLAHADGERPTTWQEVDLLEALRSQDDNDGRLSSPWRCSGRAPSRRR